VCKPVEKEDNDEEIERVERPTKNPADRRICPCCRMKRLCSRCVHLSPRAIRRLGHGSRNGHRQRRPPPLRNGGGGISPEAQRSDASQHGVNITQPAAAEEVTPRFRVTVRLPLSSPLFPTGSEAGLSCRTSRACGHARRGQQCDRNPHNRGHPCCAQSGFSKMTDPTMRARSPGMAIRANPNGAPASSPGRHHRGDLAPRISLATNFAAVAAVSAIGHFSIHAQAERMARD